VATRKKNQQRDTCPAPDVDPTTVRNEEAEAAIVGAILLDATPALALLDGVGGINPECFWRPILAAAMVAIFGLREASTPIDVITVADRMARTGYGEPEHEVRRTLMRLAADVPTVAQDVAVVIGGISYTVTDVEPDGTGLVVLRLDRAS
jgi:hypothetical protein